MEAQGRPEVAPEALMRAERRRLDALTGLRALAAGWVVLVHYRERLVEGIPGAEHLEPLMRFGYLGVDVFFVLSGFILAYTYSATFDGGVTGTTYRRFLKLRLARIYPVHLLTLHAQVALVLAAGLIGIGYEAPGVLFTFRTYVENLALVHVWFTHEPSWNIPAWSISAEWAAYLLFPFGAVWLASYKRRWISFAGAAGCFAILLAAFTTWFSHTELPGPGALTRIACEFAAGCFLYRIYRDFPWPRIGHIALPAAILIVASPWLTGSDYRYHEAIMWSPLFGLLILGLAYNRGPVAALLRLPWTVFWGEASYSLYMTHELLLQVFNKLVPASPLSGPGPAGILACTLLLAAALGVAAATYLLIERPARAWLRRASLPRRGVAPGSGEPVG